MLKNQQIISQRATKKNEDSADGGQQDLVEPQWLEKDGNKSQGLLFNDKDENGLELSLGLTYGSSQCRSSDTQRSMSDNQESRSTFKVEDKSILQELSKFRDGEFQGHTAIESEVSKSFLEHELHMLKNATSIQDVNKKLSEEKGVPLSNGKAQPVSYPLGKECWSWGKNNGEPEKLRALRQEVQEMQEGQGGTRPSSAPVFMSSTIFSRAGPQAASTQCFDFVSRNRDEIGPWSSAQLMDTVHSMDSTVSMLIARFPHLKSATQMLLNQNNLSEERGSNLVTSSNGGPGAQLSEFLQQHGIAEQHMLRDVHLQKQQEARKKRKMLIDEQKQQKKAKEDDRSVFPNGTVFRRPGSSQWPRSWEMQMRDQATLPTLDHNVGPEQLTEASPASHALDPDGRNYGVKVEESYAVRYGSQEDKIGATMNYIQRLRGEESTSFPSFSCQTTTLLGGNDDIHSSTLQKIEDANIGSTTAETFQEEQLPIQSQGHSTTTNAVAALKPSTEKPESYASMPLSDLNLQREGTGSDPFPGSNAALETTHSFPATSGSALKSSAMEDIINNEEGPSQYPKDVLDEPSIAGKDQPEKPDKDGNSMGLPLESVSMNSVLAIGQLGTTRGIPGMDILSKEPYNLQPGHAVGQTFGGSGSSPDLPWVSSPKENGKAVSGVVYRLMHGPLMVVCTCHGKHMTPTEFSKHETSPDLADKDEPSTAGAVLDGTEVTSAKE